MEKPSIGSPQVWLSGARLCPEPGYKEEHLVWGPQVPPRLPLEETSRIQIVWL
jgi:hypothetical protein